MLTALPAALESGAHMDHASHTAEAHWVLVLNRANGAYAVPPVWASAARPYICSRKRWTSAYAKYAEAKAEYAALPVMAVVTRTPKSPSARNPACVSYVAAASVGCR